MSYTLLVIDMQSGFRASNSDFLVKNVTKAIKRARKGRNEIVFIEFNPIAYGKTNPNLISVTNNYSKTHLLQKLSADGSEVICFNHFNKETYKDKRYRICGVETDVCVKATIEGLLKFGVKKNNITLLKSATSGLSKYRKTRGIKAISNLGVNLSA